MLILLPVRQFCDRSEVEICVRNDTTASKCKNSDRTGLEDVHENYCY